MHKDSILQLRKEYCKEFKLVDKNLRKAFRWIAPFVVLLLLIVFGMLITVTSDNFSNSKFEHLLKNHSIPRETKMELITIGKSFKNELHNINKDLRIKLYQFVFFEPFF